MSDPGIQNIYQWTPASSDNAQWNDAANWTLTSGPGHGGSDEFPSGSSDQADFVTGTVDCFIASPLTIGAIRTVGWGGAINSTAWRASHEITSFAEFNTGGFRAMNEARIVFPGNSNLKVGEQFNWLIVAATRPALIFQGTNTFSCEKSSLAFGASGSLTVEDGAELTINGRGTLVVERLSNLGSIINDAEIRTADYAIPANISFGTITGSGIVTITRRSTGEAVFPAFDISCNIIVARNDGVSVFSGRASHVAFEGALNTNIAFNGFEAGSMVIEPAATKLAVRSGGLSVTGNITNTGSANAASSWSQADGTVVKLSGTQDQEIDWPFPGGSATFGVEKTAGRLMLRGEPMNMYGMIHRDPASQDPTSVTEMELVVGGSLGSQVTTMTGDLAAAATVVNSTLIIPSGVTLDTKAFTASHGSQTTGAGTIRVKSGEFADPENTVSENIEIEEWGAVPPPGTPYGLEETVNTFDYIVLRWQNSAGASSYEIQRSDDTEGNWVTVYEGPGYDSIPGVISGAPLYYQDLGLDTGRRYYYQIRSKNSGGASQWAPALSAATRPGSVTGLSAVPKSQSSIFVKWNEGTIDDSFRVRCQLITDPSYRWEIKDTKNSEYTITGLESNTWYNIAVSRIRYSHESNLNIFSGVRTLLIPTGSLSAISVSQSQIDLAWSESSAATSYEIERSTDLSDWVASGTSSSTSFSVTGLEAGTTYYFRVTAKSASNNTSIPSEVAGATTWTKEPETPVVHAIATSGTRINVTWNAVEYAESYTLQQMDAGSPWQTVYEGAGTSFSAAGLVSDTVYSYRISATGPGGTSQWSEIVTVKTPVKPPPTPGRYEVIAPYDPAMHRIFGNIDIIIIAAAAMGQPAIIKRKST